MAQLPCGARIGFLVAAIVFVIIQMRLFAAEQNYSLQATSAIVTEEECQMDLRKLGDKLLTQQTTLAYLEEKKTQLEMEIKGLASELETSQNLIIVAASKRGMRKSVMD